MSVLRSSLSDMLDANILEEAVGGAEAHPRAAAAAMNPRIRQRWLDRAPNFVAGCAWLEYPCWSLATCAAGQSEALGRTIPAWRETFSPARDASHLVRGTRLPAPVHPSWLCFPADRRSRICAWRCHDVFWSCAPPCSPCSSDALHFLSGTPGSRMLQQRVHVADARHK